MFIKGAVTEMLRALIVNFIINETLIFVNGSIISKKRKLLREITQNVIEC